MVWQMFQVESVGRAIFSSFLAIMIVLKYYSCHKKFGSIIVKSKQVKYLDDLRVFKILSTQYSSIIKAAVIFTIHVTTNVEVKQNPDQLKFHFFSS